MRLKLAQQKRRVLCLRAAALFLIAPFYLSSCNIALKQTDSTPSPPPLEPATAYEVHVAFSGGGWRAHTAHSGWTMSLLNNGKRLIADAFSNVGSISSNSGGSWFSTMLVYSNSFNQAIQAPNAFANWGSTGWLGLQQKHFDAADCHALGGYKFVGCVAETVGAKATRWNEVVEDLIYKDYPLDGINLNGSRQSWAANKPLLLASSLLTTQVVLNGTAMGDKNYYQACRYPAVTVLNGVNGSSCAPSANPAPDVSPVTFSSVPSGSGYIAPNFLSKTKAGPNPTFNLGYTQNAIWGAKKEGKRVTNPLESENVPVMIAAATSSAAAGFEASARVSGHFIKSYGSADEALSFSLNNNEVTFQDPGKLTIEELAAQKFVRIADGGPVDNSGVAQLISFLQLNKKNNNFNIVAFDNVQETYQYNSDNYVGIDIAYLFGEGLCEGSKFCSDTNCDAPCIITPNLQIFKKEGLTNTPMTWSTPAGNPVRLIYTKYNVTTVNNEILGVNGNSSGTLHVFTCWAPDASTSPENKTKDGSFKAYNDMLQFINSGLQNGSVRGLDYLEEAFGL